MVASQTEQGVLSPSLACDRLSLSFLSFPSLLKADILLGRMGSKLGIFKLFPLLQGLEMTVGSLQENKWEMKL